MIRANIDREVWKDIIINTKNLIMTTKYITFGRPTVRSYRNKQRDSQMINAPARQNLQIYYQQD